MSISKIVKFEKYLFFLTGVHKKVLNINSATRNKCMAFCGKLKHLAKPYVSLLLLILALLV